MTPQVFQVLLSLSDAPRHGYAMIQDIDERTGGEIRLTASTLYDALARLVDAGLIAEVPPPAEDADRDSRRRYYALTREGRDAAATEARRLERTLSMAREKKIIGG
jgi:DNA-binding PadR family transcriptional regulator